MVETIMYSFEKKTFPHTRRSWVNHKNFSGGTMKNQWLFLFVIAYILVCR